jgi:hypothetical protein
MILLLLMLVLGVPRLAGAVVAMPLGIPSPNTATPGWDWEAQAPARPASWLTTPSTPTALFYYVCPTCAGATDTPSTRTGHPSQPRLTIPLILPPGSVVELHGAYNAQHSGNGREILSQGTLAQPVFIRGQDNTQIPTIGNQWGVFGNYLTMENLKFALGPSFVSDNNRCLFIQPKTTASVTHIVLRNSEVTGNLAAGSIQVGNPSTISPTLYGLTDLVFYHNYIHHNGGRALTSSNDDQDTHGITFTRTVTRAWVLDNEFAYNAGDGIQINAGGGRNDFIQFVYVGRNNSHHNKQSGLWTKESQDVIFSENTVHDIIRANSVPAGPCFGTHYGATRTWWIFNHCYGAESGIRFSEETNSGGGGVPPGNVNFAEQYVIGNYFHNIHTERTTFDSTSNVAQATITAVGNGASTRHFVNNTMYNIDSGFVLASHSAAPSKGEQTWILKNNIIGGLDMTRGWHLRFADPLSAAVATVTNTLFSDPATRIIWSNSGLGTIYTSIAAFQAAFPGKCAGCVLGNAGFIAPSTAARINQPDTCLQYDRGMDQMVQNPAAGCITFNDPSAQNYRITNTSPAMDHGAAASEYATFQTLYGIDIAKDLDHLARTSGGTIDIGAYEVQSGGSTHTCH